MKRGLIALPRVARTRGTRPASFAVKAVAVRVAATIIASLACSMVNPWVLTLTGNRRYRRGSIALWLSVDPALLYSLIRVADAEDHRDRGRSWRTHTDALFAGQSQSILDNLLALLHCSRV